MLVRFFPFPNPLVKAAADRSFPIVTTDIIRGTIRYSNTACGFLKKFFPVIPLIRIAFPIDPASSEIVGKNRNITENGIMNASGICIRCMARTNSLTFVVERR